MPVAAALPAIIGGVASIGGAVIASNSANRQGQAVQQAADSSNATQLQIYNQQRADAEPWRQFGLQALGQLSSLYNFNWQAPQSMTGGQWQQQPGNSGSGSYSGGGIGQGGYNTGGSGLIGNLMGQVPGNNPTGLPTAPVQDAAALSGDSSPGGVNALMAPSVGQPQINGGPNAALSGTGADQPQINGGPNVQTMTGTGATPPATQPGGMNFAAFYASPDYQFRLNEGNRNRLNAFANTGNLDSGAAQRELLRFGQDTASGEFSNYVNRLASFAGVGQTVNSQNNALAQGYANNVQANNNFAAQGRAQSAYQQGQAWQQGLGGVAGAGMWAVNNYPWGK